MEYLAEVYHLCKAYPNFSLEDINLTVPCGSIVGLIGENGAGKTTTLKALSGVIRPDGGELRLLEQGASKKTREQVAVVWEDSYFDGILCPAQISKVMSGICSIWDAPLFSSYCKRFALAEKQQLKTFSRGMRMKLSLATALARHPLLLILDEATGGLDPVVRGEILDLFLEFIQDEQHGIMITMLGFLFLNTLSLDEHCEWNRYVRTLPTESKEIMGAKYIVCLLCIIGGVVFGLMLGALGQFIRMTNFTEILWSSVATVAITLVMMAFMFPVALKWTVEKARNVFVMVFMLVFVGGGLIAKTLNLDALSNIPLIPISIGICVCAVLMYVISYCVSCRIYEKKEF